VKIVYSILSNKTVTVPMIAWFVAQFLKVVNVIVVERKLDFTRFIGSGGMPSFSFLIYCFSCNCGRKNEGIRFGRVWDIGCGGPQLLCMMPQE